jgi:hypothetical protein
LLVYLVKPQIWPFLRAGLAVNPSQNLDTLEKRSFSKGFKGEKERSSCQKLAFFKKVFE